MRSSFIESQFIRLGQIDERRRKCLDFARPRRAPTRPTRPAYPGCDDWRTSIENVADTTEAQSPEYSP